ncbi:MAG: cobalamin-dependent protein [Nitrospirae bacterium]|nr:cobalamin-dependent protein [Nitrospirota bacterium]
MMVFLVRPFTQVTSRAFAFGPPVSLAYMAGFLKSKGISVKIIDYEELVYSMDSMYDLINAHVPSAIGFSAYTNTIQSAHKIASDIKKRYPQMPTIVGGHHSTAMAEETLREFPDFDIVVIGEGELTLYEVVERITQNKPLNGTAGIAYREGSNIITEPSRSLIQNLDELPFPDRSLIQSNVTGRHFTRGILMGKGITSVYTSRGCHYNCIFCAVNRSHSVDNKPVRYRSIENVCEELQECSKKYGYKHIHFQDDSFSLTSERVIPIADKLKALGMTWNCDFRANTVNKELLSYMKKSGLIKVSIGVESGSPRILELNNKKITVEQVKRAFKICHEVGIKMIEGTFLIGSHPDETMQDIEMTIALFKEIKPDLSAISIATPYPGTKLREIMLEKGLVFSNDWGKYMLASLPGWRTIHFTPEELVRLQKKLVRIFYLNPHTFLHMLQNRSFFMHALKGGLEFFLSKRNI